MDIRITPFLALGFLMLGISFAFADETPPLPPERPSAVLDLSTLPLKMLAERPRHLGNIATYQPRYVPDSAFYVAPPAAGYPTQARVRVRVFFTGGKLAGFSARD